MLSTRFAIWMWGFWHAVLNKMLRRCFLVPQQLFSCPWMLLAELHESIGKLRESMACECVCVMQGADVDSVWTSYLLADEIGNRTDAYRGYLEPVIGSCTNLEVTETATVTKLLLDGNATATGVQYQTEQAGTPQVLKYTDAAQLHRLQLNSCRVFIAVLMAEIARYGSCLSFPLAHRRTGCLCKETVQGKSDLPMLQVILSSSISDAVLMHVLKSCV